MFDSVPTTAIPCLQSTMTTHFGSTATAFYARTFYGFLVGDNVHQIRPPIGPGELGVMLASLNFSMMDGRGGMCPMCTDEGPCFLCSDELSWKEYINIQAQRPMVLCPIHPFHALRTWDIPESAPPSSELAHPAFWYKTGGEVYDSGIVAAPDSEIEAAMEPLFVQGRVLRSESVTEADDPHC